MSHTVNHSIAKTYWYSHSFKYIQIHNVCYVTFLNMPLCVFFTEQFLVWYNLKRVLFLLNDCYRINVMFDLKFASALSGVFKSLTF